ncbi:transporter [Nibricoccus aquaticus]|nr:transporter [Nibricoccus aquaticus]
MISPRTFIAFAGGITFAGALLAQTTATSENNNTTEAAPSSVESAAPAEVVGPVNSMQVGTGFDYSRGSYGFAEDTEVFSVPLLLTYNVEKWVLRASVPYLKIKGPADAVGTTGASGGGGSGSSSGLSGVVPGLPGSTSGGTTSASTPARPVSNSESGIGDVMLGATRMLGPVIGPVQVDLTARVKLPTADEAKGLGTGETDYYAQADFYYAGQTFIPFATLGYRFMTDSDLYALENGAYASLGSAYRLTDTTRAGVSLDWRQKIVDGGDDATEVSVFVAHDFSPRWNLILYALTGFTDASPDFGTGGSVSYRF